MKPEYKLGIIILCIVVYGLYHLWAHHKPND